jgi:hypothetical protein
MQPNSIPRTAVTLLRSFACMALLIACAAQSQPFALEDLARLSPGRTKAENALWIENPLTAQFKTSKRVVVADLKGPAVITMIHFAYGHSQIAPPHKRLNRDLLLRMYWDGENSPSVDVPLVDFFCDPAGTRDELNTALVNVRRGFNAYFPMPFRKSAKIELVYEGTVAPGEELWRLMPCYSYVIYRTEKKIPADTAYFHAAWRQEGLLLGKQDYVALEAKGKGKFVGWNVTVRQPGRSGYPVDENAKFFVDGETNASVELQGIEDAFGFSWGFPETENLFPLAGYFPFFKGAAAYRFFVPDAINFQKSLRVAIGFGVNEDPMFRRQFSKPGSTLQLSTTVYWYQREPHAPLPAMPSAADRAPAPEEPFWPLKETLPAAAELKARGVKLHMRCGRPGKEVIFAESGYAAAAKKGYAWKGWPLPVYHARAGNEEVEIDLTVPPGASGTVRVFMIDPDDFEGGRKQTVSIAGESLGTIEKFTDGRWLQQLVTPAQTATGKILVRAANARKGSNAVISIVELVAAVE